MDGNVIAFYELDWWERKTNADEWCADTPIKKKNQQASDTLFNEIQIISNAQWKYEF